MNPFKTHTGVAAPLRRTNIDTDQICAAQFLKRITKTGYEDALFAEWRKDDDFVLNQPVYKDTSILVVGANFGTGSSREHAVWALRDYGIKVIIGSSFADIFRGNSGKQGMLLAVLTPDEVEKIFALIEANPGLKLTVDLESTTVTCGDKVFNFSIDSFTRYKLLEGLDEIGVTLKYEEDILAFESKRPAWKARI
ncbi:MAG TPA: 3-isopropylmalate dehydratase small subunit [Microbacteriaceae bacterium]|nr:3-isopropylmalate dehydratase small subunit [Microbacteriaceae bacterium]